MLLREDGERRYKEWRTRGSVTDVERDVTEEIKARINGWESFQARCNPDGVPVNDRGYSVAQAVGLDWGAKIICSMAVESDVLRKGYVAYEAAYDNNLLPWQRMNLSFN